MKRAWAVYQDDVATLFSSLGMKTSIEAQVQGVRATHKIDVLVSFDLLGLKITWIVECKSWRASVPKEKVLALHQISQDIGADRAFLFSETSFQPGAVSAARSTNISLTSLADLRNIVREDIVNLQFRTALSRLPVLERSARSGFTDEEGALHRPNPENFDESIYLAGCCLFLERAAVRGLVRDFPVIVGGVDSSVTEEFSDASSLAAFLVRQLDEIEKRLARMQWIDSGLIPATASFVNSVRSLLDASEEALTKISLSDPNLEAKQYECLALMKAVGRGSEELRYRGGSQFQAALRATMRHLIDTVYLDLTKPSVSKSYWMTVRHETERRLAELQAAAVVQ
jgi:hypothetical protein